METGFSEKEFRLRRTDITTEDPSHKGRVYLGTNVVPYASQSVLYGEPDYYTQAD